MSQWFPSLVYVLCFVTSSGCAGLLARGFLRSRYSMLLWSALCFALLAANNLIVVVDMILLPDLDLRLPRLLLSLGAVLVLLIGFIWGRES